jgi:hypothetical protein
MAAVKTVLRYKFRILLRTWLSRKYSSVGSLLFVLAVLFSIRNKYFQYLHDMALEVGDGSFEKLISACFVLFLLWVLAAFGSVAQTCRFPVSRLQIFPLSHNNLFLVHGLDVFLDLFILVLVAVSGGILFPVARSGGPALFLMVFFFLVCCGLLFFLLRTLVLLSPFYALLSGLLLILITLSGALLLNNSENQVSPASIYTALLILLLDCLLLFFSFQTFKQVLARPEKHTVKRRKLWLNLPCPTQLIALLNKDIRYIFRILDGYLGIIVSLYYIYYLASESNPDQASLWVFITIPFLFNSGLAINVFGTESAGSISRCLFSPLKGASIFLSKNFAYFFLVSVQYIPIIVLAVVRFGFVTGLTAALVVFSIAIIDVAIGNYRSMQHPIETGFFRFTSDSSPQTLVSILLLIFVGDLPAFFALILFHNFGLPLLFAAMTLSVSLIILYVKVIVPQQGKLFESMDHRFIQVLPHNQI